MHAVNILECTLRDGSYAINFQFSARETAVLAHSLEQAGLRHIEIGHGLGLNAANVGKGKAAQEDAEYMRAVADTLQQAQWGMFCIPGIARLQDLKLAADHGMGFVRIGLHAGELPAAEPFLTEAKRRGMFVFINFMKSYTVGAREFGRVCRSAAGMGADAAYLVDSAGCMLPDDVVAYLDEARAACDVQLGFHGHDNLRLSVANALAACRSHATWIDTTLQGMGRSSGNPPTEVTVAVLKRLGQLPDLNLKMLLHVGATCVKPLLQATGMAPLDVICGYTGFHSGFAGVVLRIAKEENAHPLDVIAALCEKTRLEAPEELVRAICREQQGGGDAASPELPPSLFEAQLALGDEGSLPDTTLQRIKSEAAKRSGLAILNLVAQPDLDTPQRFSHVVYEYPDIVLGSAEIATPEGLREILEKARAHCDFFFVDTNRLQQGGPPLAALAAELAGNDKVLEYDDTQLWRRCLMRQLRGALGGMCGKRIAMFGGEGFAPALAAELEAVGAAVLRCGPWPQGQGLLPTPEALEQADALVVFATGLEAHEASLLHKDFAGPVFDALLGRLSPGLIRRALEAGLAVFRPDMRAGLVAELRMAISYGLGMQTILKARPLSDVRLVSHGFIGNEGDVVVDNVLEPQSIFGIADGRGGTLPPSKSPQISSQLASMLLRRERNWHE